MSKAVEKFNGLNGSIQAKELKKIVLIAAKEGQQTLHQRCINALELAKQNNLDVFEKDGNAVAQVPLYLLYGLEENPKDIDAEEIIGLNKAVSPDEIYQMITDKMILLVEKATTDAKMPEFKVESGYTIPFNFDSKKPYRGINKMMLTDFGLSALENPFFFTFKQIQKHKGKLKKGSTGNQVIYFTTLYSYDNPQKKLKIHTYNVKSFISWINKNLSKLEIQKDAIPSFIKMFSIPIIKYYNVFNGSDISGIDYDLENFKKGFIDVSDITGPTDPRITAADLIIENFPKPAPEIFYKGKEAFYQRKSDSVTLPRFESYRNGVDFYRLAFHELTHATGHPNRLMRVMGKNFGDKEYAKEELIAEFGSIFLCSHAGFLWRTQQGSADYLKNWAASLKYFKEDNRLLMRAGSAAQKAADFILNLDANGVPEFEKQLLKIGKTQKIELVKPTPKPVKAKAIKKTASVKTAKRPTTEDLKNEISKKEIEILTRTDFEKALKGLGLKVFKKETNTKSASNFTVNYQLNFKDVAGVTLQIKAEKPKKEIHYESKINVFGLTLEDSGIYENPSAFYEAVYEELRNIFKKISVSELADLKKEYKKTLFSNTPKNQLALLAPAVKKPRNTTKKNTQQKKTGLRSPSIQPKKSQEGTRVTGVNSLPSASVAKKVSSIKEVAQKAPLFNIPGETGKFFQAIERKPVGSVVIAIDTEQGTGKTTSLYKFMNDFAEGGNSCLFASLEEHPQSNLATSKRDKFLSQQAQNNIDTVYEFDDYNDFCNIVEGYDGIFVDSWPKLLNMMRGIHLDQDIRMKFDSKVFFIIFQQTTTGRTKGGAEIVFDCDVVTKGFKSTSFSENYLFFDKNRYTEIPLEHLKYMIAEGKTIIENETTSTTIESQNKKPSVNFAYSFQEK